MDKNEEMLNAEKTAAEKAADAEGMQELSADELSEVSGGGFEDFPRVEDNDYTDDITDRI